MLGKELELFRIDDELGSGLVLWLPNLGDRARGAREPGGARCTTSAATRSSTRRTSRTRRSISARATSRTTATTCTARCARRGHAELLDQADELPGPHQGLPVEDPLVPRAADAHRRARHGLSLRARRHAARHAARPRLHAGRLAHLLHVGAGAGGDRQGLRPRDRVPRARSATRTPHLPRPRGPRSDSAPTRCGTRRRRRWRTRSASARCRTRSTRAAACSTRRRSTSRSTTRSGASGRARRSSSTSTCRSASTSRTSTIRASASAR